MSTTHDSHLMKMAANEVKNQLPEIPEVEDQVKGMDVVPVRQMGSDTFNAFTTVVATGTNPVRLLVPRDPDRYSATITTIDQDVVLANNFELASNPANQVTSVPHPSGYYLSKGTQVVVHSRGPIYVAATNSTATRVSVIVEKYENENSKP